MKKLLIFFIIITLSVVSYFIFFHSKNSTEEVNISNVSLDEVSAKLELGKALYYTHGASCHDDNLHVQPKWKTAVEENEHNYAPP